MLRALRDPSDPTDTIGPRWLKSAALDVTALDGVTVLCTVIAAVVGYLALERKRHIVLVAALGGQLMSTALKLSFDRARPSTSRSARCSPSSCSCGARGSTSSPSPAR